MDAVRSLGHIIVLFIEVFFVCVSILFLVGAVLSTPWALFGVAFSLGGLIYAIIRRDEDLIDRQFYFIIGLLFTFTLAFIDLKM